MQTGTSQTDSSRLFRQNHNLRHCDRPKQKTSITDPNCPTHRHNNGSPLRNSSIVGISTEVELEEVDENDESDQAG